jgi:cytochrome c oxidase assembly factor CtaG
VTVLPLLHASGSVQGSFVLAWTGDPILIATLLVAAAGYVLAWRRLQRTGRRALHPRQAAAYGAGLAAVALALLGPLDTFNDDLFVVHMLQHVVLMFVAAPLLVAGRPVQLLLGAISPAASGSILRPLLRRRPLRAALTVLTHPVVVGLLFNLNLILWHLPGFYTRALENRAVHEVEHVTFFGTSLLLWWIIVARCRVIIGCHRTARSSSSSSPAPSAICSG